MTWGEAANSMRRLADGIEKVIRQMGKDAETGLPKPMFADDTAVGAAVMLCYIRDLFTLGHREVYDRPSLLVILEAISRDKELFPCGLAQVMWQMEHEELNGESD